MVGQKHRWGSAAMNEILAPEDSPGQCSEAQPTAQVANITGDV